MSDLEMLIKTGLKAVFQMNKQQHIALLMPLKKTPFKSKENTKVGKPQTDDGTTPVKLCLPMHSVINKSQMSLKLRF